MSKKQQEKKKFQVSERKHEQQGNIQSMSTNQLYSKAKLIMRNLNIDKVSSFSYDFEPLLSLPDNRVKKVQVIFRYVVRRLTRNSKMDTNEFIGYLSILCYLLPMAKAYKFSLTFQNNFYRNTVITLHKIFDNWNKLNDQSEKQSKLISLSTILFIYSNFSSWASEQQTQVSLLNIKWSRIFNSKVIKMFLTINYPCEQRVMKFYRIIMLFFVNWNKKNLLNSELINSVGRHLIQPGQSEDTKNVLVYILSKIDQNSLNILPIQTISQIGNIVVQKISRKAEENKNYFKFFIQFFRKLVNNFQNLADLIYIAPLRIFYILQNLKDILYFKMEDTKNLYKFTKRLNTSEKLTLLKELTLGGCLPIDISSIIIVQACLSTPNLEALAYMSDSNLSLKIIQEVANLKNNGSKSRVLTLRKIYCGMLHQNLNTQISFTMNETARIYLGDGDLILRQKVSSTMSLC